MKVLRRHRPTSRHELSRAALEGRYGFLELELLLRQAIAGTSFQKRRDLRRPLFPEEARTRFEPGCELGEVRRWRFQHRQFEPGAEVVFSSSTGIAAFKQVDWWPTLGRDGLFVIGGDLVRAFIRRGARFGHRFEPSAEELNDVDIGVVAQLHQAGQAGLVLAGDPGANRPARESGRQRGPDHAALEDVVNQLVEPPLEALIGPVVAVQRWHREQLADLGGHPDFCVVRGLGFIGDARETQAAAGRARVRHLGPAVRRQMLVRRGATGRSADSSGHQNERHRSPLCFDHSMTFRSVCQRKRACWPDPEPAFFQRAEDVRCHLLALRSFPDVVEDDGS